MSILLLKAAHIIAVVSWFAGLLYLPRLFVYHADCEDEPGRERFTLMQQRLYKRIMGPAMVITIVLGLMLMRNHAGLWLWLKLGCVVAVIAFHISCGRYIKKLAAGTAPSARFFRFYNEIPTVLMVVIVFLVVFKPVL